MPLSAEHIARLQILHQWVTRGKIAPESAQAAEYQRLVVAQQTGVDPPEEPEARPSEALAPLALLTEKEQAAFYAVTSRTIRHWKARKAPLSRPSEMPAWWPRGFPNIPINPKILRALKKAQPVIPGTSIPAPPVPPEPPPPRPPIPEEEIGFDQTHRRMLEEEARLHREMEDLRRAGDFAGASALRAEWTRLSTSLGGADTKALRNAMQRGDLISREVIEREFSLLMAHHPQVIRHELKAIREKLDPPPARHVWDPAIDKLLDELFRAFPDLLIASLQQSMPATE